MQQYILFMCDGTKTYVSVSVVSGCVHNKNNYYVTYILYLFKIDSSKSEKKKKKKNMDE